MVESITNSPDKILQVRLTNLLLDWAGELRQIRLEKEGSTGDVRANRQGLETMLLVCQEQVEEVLSSVNTPLNVQDMLQLLGQQGSELMLLYSDLLKEAESSPPVSPPMRESGS